MPNRLKPHGFLPTIPLYFTRKDQDAYTLIHFRDSELSEDDALPALECPDHWSIEAAAIMAQEASFNGMPTQSKAVEENIVPSWLWRHSATSKKVTRENKVQQIFDRVVGGATYKGWKQELFADEFEARHFFDEMRYALAMRFVAIEPSVLTTLGIDWAYGATATTPSIGSSLSTPIVDITNATIDAIVSGSTDKNRRGPWQSLLHARQKNSVTLCFVDTARDWGDTGLHSIPVTLDILAFRHNDGSVNIDMLRHAVRLVVTLLELHDVTSSCPLAIGLSNLAPLLTALALPYDSEAGRMTAAALMAIVTAEAYSASAQMAELCGATPAFHAERENILRAMRNHHRAVYGDLNDYEKISVLPQPLMLTPGLDLALVAAAQRLWDAALEVVRQSGLRHTQLTAMQTSTSLAFFTESFTQGIDASPALTVIRSDDGETFTQHVHSSVTEALSRLGYNAQHQKNILAHIVGFRSLTHAPVINHTSLQERGFDTSALEAIENYLPYVNDLRLAFTPWIIGEEFCRTTLGLSSKQIQNPHFDMLRHLGFSAIDIAAAHKHFYGHGTVKGAKDLRSEHASIFAQRHDISAEATIRMAAAIQGFVSGQVSLALTLSDKVSDKNEALILSAWRQGIKVMTLTRLKQARDETMPKPTRVASKAFLNAKKSELPARQSKPKAGARFVGMGNARGKGLSLSKSKTR